MNKVRSIWNACADYICEQAERDPSEWLASRLFAVLFGAAALVALIAAIAAGAWWHLATFALMAFFALVAVAQTNRED